jgi:FtsP/CotA-like multicopper oxidase with cupredoxin domain
VTPQHKVLNLSAGQAPGGEPNRRSHTMTARTIRKLLLPIAVAAALGASASAGAAVFVQCGPNNTGVDAEGRILPRDADGRVLDPVSHNPILGADGNPVECMHITGGDGFISMADGRPLYTFGFVDVTGEAPSAVGLDSLGAQFSAPTIELRQGDEFYLTLSNVAMALRPDLFDPHTVHFHGFPQAAPVFDGLPEGSFGANMGSSFTYYYKLIHPGTYLYHCHQEATEHMQMGMLGNLYVKPIQDNVIAGPNPDSVPTALNGQTLAGYTYNDGDGSTGYHVSKALQITSMDHVFHELHLGVQPLPFKNMRDTYAMINGRGYPDTVNPGDLPAPAPKADYGNTTTSQPINALITATQGQRILLRVSNLSVTAYYTLAAQGLTMNVVGQGARELRGQTGTVLHYDTSSITLGGGESMDVIIDTLNVQPGTYFLYTTNMKFLSNFDEDNGGMMTEIVIAAAP